MKKGHIIDDAKKRKVGTKFIIHGKIPEGATIDQIVAMVIDNGEDLVEEIGHETEGKPEETKGKPIESGKAKEDSTEIEEPVGYSESEIETTSDEAKKDDEEKEEEKKKAPAWLGKAVKIGTAALAAALLISAIATTKISVNEKTVTPSDYTVTNEASDIISIRIGDQDVQIPSSVIENPGILIKHQRAEYLAENNGSYEGIREYFENSTDESRVSEEERIEEITKSFDEQQQIINEATQVIQDENATDAQKQEALKKIQAAKDAQLGIYEGNMDLFLMYNQDSIDAFNRNGGDDRTAYEEAVAKLEVSEYGIAMQNLQRDVLSISASIGTLETPEVLFEETSPEAGTTEKSYVIDTELFGKPVKIWEKSDTYYISVDYDTDLQLTEGHQVGEGEFTISADEIVNTETTKKNIFAVAEIVKRLANHQDLGEISIYGHTVYGNNEPGDK